MNKTHKKSEKIRQFILENVEDHPGDIASFAADKFGITRQATHRHIAHLVESGALVADGATRSRIYAPKPLAEISVQLPLRGLEEDKVWRTYVRPALENVPANVIGICQYGFTEMVNNAIDHSQGTVLEIGIKRTFKIIQIDISDNGIGIFEKIRKELNLDDALHAILELSKGRLTTDPAHHTGEGVFFTSRIFDEFFMSSGKLRFIHYLKRDWLVEDNDEQVIGTSIRLRITPKSSRTAQQVMEQYTTNEDLTFSKTIVPVFLATYGDENLVSRSQAKRLLMRFDRFKEIVLDFSKVSSIGQAFADEVFRVFVTEHPGTRLVPFNANKQISQMISRVTNEM